MFSLEVIYAIIEKTITFRQPFNPRLNEFSSKEIRRQSGWENPMEEDDYYMVENLES